MKEIPYVDLARQHQPIRQEILSAVGRVLDHGRFILGEEVERLECQFAEYCGTQFAVGVNSGTDALFLSLKAYGIGAGDEVITVPNSFLATASAVVATGARPVFVDVAEDMNMDPQLLEAKVTAATRAIIPVHLAGRVAAMDPIMEVAGSHGLVVIEDAAQAVGAEYKGRKAGSLGHCGCFSLHPLKTLSACGDGGLITTNDKGLYETLLQLRNIGLKNRDQSYMWGYNSRLDAVQAAIATVKLKYLDSWLEQRRNNAAYYIEHLRHVVEVPDDGSDSKPGWHTFVIRTEHRDELQQHLASAGVGTRVHYPIPIHLQTAAKSLGYQRGDFPVCERHAETILSLPVYQGLTEQELGYVVHRVREFFGRHARADEICPSAAGQAFSR